MKTDHSKSPRTIRNRSPRSPLLISLFVLLLVVVAIAFYFYGREEKRVNAYLENVKQSVTETFSEKEQTVELKTDQPQPETDRELSPSTVEESDQTEETEGVESLGPDEKATPQESLEAQSAVTTLNNFYENLDGEEYFKQFQLGESARTHFSKVIQKLLENPPVVVEETDDLYTLLKNTAHFFRVMGSKNVRMLKGILDRERDQLEDILQSFYILTAHPEILKKEYDIDMTQNELYDYASFFLTTMGGRLYLFRRDSSSRMVVTYYALLIVDKANDEHESRYGIDIRPPLDALTEEMENGGQQLKYRNSYLQQLHNLQEKYKR